MCTGLRSYLSNECTGAFFACLLKGLMVTYTLKTDYIGVIHPFIIYDFILEQKIKYLRESIIKLHMIKPLLCQDCNKVPTFMYQNVRCLAQAEKPNLVLTEKNFPRKRASCLMMWWIFMMQGGVMNLFPWSLNFPGSIREKKKICQLILTEFKSKNFNQVLRNWQRNKNTVTEVSHG